MIIKSISTEIITIPLKTPFITALRKVTDVEFVRVSVVFEGDIVSYGEAPATKAVTGEDLESITKTIQENKKVFYENQQMKETNENGTEKESKKNKIQVLHRQNSSGS